MPDSKVNLGAGAPEAEAYAAEKEAEKTYFGDLNEFRDPKYTFGLTDLFERVVDEGVPANARAYLESVYARATGQEPPVFGADYFTEDQLERIRDIIEQRDEAGYSYVEGWNYPKDSSGEEFRSYTGPGKDFRGLGSLLNKLYNTDALLGTSLGGFVFKDEGDRWRVHDPFDFTGLRVEDVGDLTRVLAPTEGPANFYSVLRDLAPTLVSDEMLDEAGSGPDWTPVFSFTIPKEGPVLPPESEEYAEGGPVSPELPPQRGVPSLLDRVSRPTAPKNAREAALDVQILQKAGINAAAYPDDPAIAAQMNKILGRKKED